MSAEKAGGRCKSYLRRSASSVRNTVQSSSFLRGSVLGPLILAEEMVRGSGGI